MAERDRDRDSSSPAVRGLPPRPGDQWEIRKLHEARVIGVYSKPAPLSSSSSYLLNGDDRARILRWGIAEERRMNKTYLPYMRKEERPLPHFVSVTESFRSAEPGPRMSEEDALRQDQRARAAVIFGAEQTPPSAADDRHRAPGILGALGLTPLGTGIVLGFVLLLAMQYLRR
eukprot:m51a1_g10610 putative C-tail anchored protein (173) ;mRNA; f:45779-46297